ncbi:MAG TPA: deoxyhypusine synthase [Terriglobia bacterium]|nr:deoxyhypusine synthase [Terriglobia bacterium]
MESTSRFLHGQPIEPPAIDGNISIVDLIDKTFNAYNAARFREACHLFTERMLSGEVTIGMSLSGAMTPAGIGMAAIIPLMRAGFVDWIVSTGANLYHDTHFGIGLEMRRGLHNLDDRVLREEGVVRIYDIFFQYDVLLKTDQFFREIISAPEFQRTMSTAEFHHLAGKYVLERSRVLGLKDKSLLGAAQELGVPIYTSSPGDSSIGMNVAAKALEGNKLQFDVNADVNETAAIVYGAKKSGQKSAILIVGGGSPKNFVLQTEPQIQEVLGLDEKGHDYYLQFTDARADTGGLSGATPAEAVTWGKVDPERLPDAVVCYIDSTVALPLLTAYVMAKRKPRPAKALYHRRAELVSSMKTAAGK